MRPHEKVYIRSVQDPFYPGTPGFFGGQQGGSYPGLDPAGGSPNWPVPYTPQTPGAGGGGGGTGGFNLSNLNLNQVKGFIDKMGGIDGIVSTMTRVQKMVSSFQQMAPMLKLLMGSFGGAKASSKAVGGDDLDGLAYPRRRRRKKSKKRTVKNYRPAGAGKTWTRKGRKRR